MGTHLETDDVIAASVVAIEFITMVTGAGRFAEGARMLRHLQDTSEFGALAAWTVLAAPVAMMAEAGHEAGSQSVRLLDDRQALKFMGAVLDELT